MQREHLAALENPSSEPQEGTHRVKVSRKRLKTALALGMEGGPHPEHAEWKRSLCSWMAACAGPYRGAQEGNKATLPGKGKIYLSHAQKAVAKLMLILISLIRGQSLVLKRARLEIAPWMQQTAFRPADEIKGTFPCSQFLLSVHCVKRAEISRRVFTRDKANFHKPHQWLLTALGVPFPLLRRAHRGRLGMGEQRDLPGRVLHEK